MPADRNSLAELDPVFAKLAEQEHSMTSGVIDSAVENDFLPETFRLGSISQYAGQLAVVESFYNALVELGNEQGRDLEPVIIFSPPIVSIKRPSSGQELAWDNLIKGYDISEVGKSEGFAITWTNSRSNKFYDASAGPSPLDEQPEELNLNAQWDVAVSCDTDRPVFIRITPDLTMGPDKDRTISALKNLGANDQEVEPNELTDNYKTPINVYNMLQLRRLIRQEGLLDYPNSESQKQITGTFLRGRVTMFGYVLPRVPLGQWNPDRRKVLCTGRHPGSPNPHSGIRPTRMARDYSAQ